MIDPYIEYNNEPGKEETKHTPPDVVSSIDIAHERSVSQISVQLCEQPQVLLQVTKAAFTHALNLRTTDSYSFFSSSSSSCRSKKSRNRKKNVIHIKALVDEGDPQERSRMEEILYRRLMCGDKLIAYDTGIWTGPEKDGGGSEGTRVRRCKACGAAFASWAALRAHRASAHAPIRAYACDQCGAAFARSDTLRAHTRVHTGERPFLCERCGATFAQAANLRQHLRVHTGLRPHRCASCCASFTQLCNLRKHERVHAAAQNPCPCSVCGVVFAHAAALKRHARKHGPAPHDVARTEQLSSAGSDEGRRNESPLTTAADAPVKPCNSEVKSTVKPSICQQQTDLADIGISKRSFVSLMTGVSGRCNMDKGECYGSADVSCDVGCEKPGAITCTSAGYDGGRVENSGNSVDCDGSRIVCNVGNVGYDGGPSDVECSGSSGAGNVGNGEASVSSCGGGAADNVHSSAGRGGAWNSEPFQCDRCGACFTSAAPSLTPTRQAPPSKCSACTRDGHLCDPLPDFFTLAKSGSNVSGERNVNCLFPHCPNTNSSNMSIYCRWK